MSAIDIVVRALAGSMSVIAFYLAWCVYEDEEKALQNKIDDWWVYFDDLRGRMVSRQAAFVLVIASKLEDVLEKVFGFRLVSVLSLAVLTCLSLTSFLWFLSVVNMMEKPFWPAAFFFMAGILPLAFCVASSIQARFRLMPIATFYLIVAGLLAILLAGIWLQWFVRDRHFTNPSAATLYVVRGSLEFPIGFATGILIAQVTVSCIRVALNRSKRTSSEWPFILGLTIPLLLIGAATYSLSIVESNLCESAIIDLNSIKCIRIFESRALTYALPTIAFCAAFASACILTASVMLFHRLVWPLVTRMLYSISRFHVLENKRWLNTLGIALLGVCLSGRYGWSQIAKFIGL